MVSLNKNDVITGEKIQHLCHLYLGETNEDFLYNPTIGLTNKNKLIKDINENFNNPKIIFCYSYLIYKLIEKIDYFNNPFVLISGNSDENITENEKYLELANHSKIIMWYTQNLSIYHNKIKPLPIGIANSQWQHGNINLFENIIHNMPEKVNNIYFNFQVNTNSEKRYDCYNKLNTYLDFLPNINPTENFYRLATYKFCICPEGNGYDSHRIWECYYLKVVPIVLNNAFIQIIKKEYNIPLIILEDWNEIKNIKLNYSLYTFDYTPIINLRNIFKSS